MKKSMQDLHQDLSNAINAAAVIAIEEYGLRTMSKATLVIRDPDDPTMFIIVSNEDDEIQKSLARLIYGDDNVIIDEVIG